MLNTGDQNHQYIEPTGAAPKREGATVTDQGLATEGDRGQRLAKFAPLGVGVRLGLAPVNTSWPFPRSFEIYEKGILVQALGTTAWIPRTAIESMRRGPGYVRIKWELGGGTRSATVSDWFRIGPVKRALEQAGYPLER